VNTTLLIVGVIFGAVILVAALKAALGPENKQHRKSDSGSGVFIGDSSSRSKNDDNDFDGDSGGDGGGGD
jgi:hypothetical protein